MDLSKVIVGAILLLLIGGLGFVALNTPKGEDSAERPSGALSGPDISSPYLKWGEIAIWNTEASMRAATTTLCAIPNPQTATSTIKSITWQITTGTTTAAAITVATSTSQYATSTSNELIADQAVASEAQGTANWVPGVNTGILGPNEYLLVKTAGAGLGGYTYTGTCSAQFEAL